MKRYIRSDVDYDRLAFEKDGETWHLPTWYADRSDEEIESLKRTLIDAKPRAQRNYEPIQIDEQQVRRNLRKEGFNRLEIDEIIAMVYNGMTMDAAIQRQYMNRAHQ